MVTTPQEPEKIPENGKGPLDKIPKSPEEALAKKESRKMEVVKGSMTAVAEQMHIPDELANMFFVKLGDQLYIKVAGLEYIAGKMGVGRTEIADHFDAESKTWIAEAKIYPMISTNAIKAISLLDKDLQRQAFEELTKPTNVIGTANEKNVKMSTMIPFLREMAQTRAKGRALRAYTHYGSSTYEEMPEAEIKAD